MKSMDTISMDGMCKYSYIKGIISKDIVYIRWSK